MTSRRDTAEPLRDKFGVPISAEASAAVSVGDATLAAATSAGFGGHWLSASLRERPGSIPFQSGTIAILRRPQVR
jgi:hypothetical protein